MPEFRRHPIMELKNMNKVKKKRKPDCCPVCKSYDIAIDYGLVLDQTDLGQVPEDHLTPFYCFTCSNEWREELRVEVSNNDTD